MGGNFYAWYKAMERKRKRGCISIGKAGCDRKNMVNRSGINGMIRKTDADNYRALSVSVPVAEAGTGAAVSDGLLLVRKSRIMRIMNERISRCFFVRLIFIQILPFLYYFND